MRSATDLELHAEARALRIGEPVPPVGFTDLAGKRFDTGQLKGKSVVLYFWTDACGCTEQLIALRSFIAGLKAGTVSSRRN